MANYIKDLRKKVGKDMILLNFVGAYIENNKGEILLQRRADKNKWGFLGGAIEIGESAEEAIVREVHEESGLNIKVDELYGVYTKYYDSYPNGDQAQPIVILLKCKIISGELNCSSDETLELRFFPRNKIPSLVNKQHTDILNDILKGNKYTVR